MGFGVNFRFYSRDLSHRNSAQEALLYVLKVNTLQAIHRSPVRFALSVRQLLRRIHEACGVNAMTQACPLLCLGHGPKGISYCA